jgi:Chitobiase/beta-hexosaminidase C-terminal domain
VYTIKPYAATPKFSKTTGTYKGAQTETITDTTPGAVIYYTTNQTTPTTSSKRYTGAFAVSESQYVQAIAVAPNYTTSFIGSVNLAITK